MNDFFTQLQTKCNDRQLEWDSENKIDLTFRALEFITESGELAEQVKKLIRSNKGLTGNKTDLTKIKDEIGDVIITLTILANTIDPSIDIIQSTIDKFNKTSDKYNFNTRF